MTLIHWGFAVLGGVCCVAFLRVDGGWKLVVLALAVVPQLVWLGFVVWISGRAALGRWG